MPIHQHKNIAKTIKLGMWVIEEDIDELLNIAKNKNINIKDIPEVKNQSKIKQWLATRLLLNNYFTDVTIVYNEKGKPFLSNGWNISISHSGDYVVILLNEKNNCGIDIEKISNKTEKIKHKFLNESDLKKIITEQDLTIYWSAKETLYKFYGKKEVLFIENLFIEDFSSSKNTFTGIINMPDLKTKLNLVWEKIEDYILVYTTNT